MVLKSLFFFYYSLLKQSMTKKDTAIMWTIHAEMEDLFHPNSRYSSINDGSVEMKLIGKWLKVNEGIVFCFVDKLPTDSTGKRSRLQRYYGRKKMFASFNDWSERNVLLSGWKNFLNGKRKKEKEIEKEKKKQKKRMQLAEQLLGSAIPMLTNLVILLYICQRVSVINQQKSTSQKKKRKNPNKKFTVFSGYDVATQDHRWDERIFHDRNVYSMVIRSIDRSHPNSPPLPPSFPCVDRSVGRATTSATSANEWPREWTR